MVITTYMEKLKPTSSNGYGIKVSHTFTSFDEKVVDDMEKKLIKDNNSCFVFEISDDLALHLKPSCDDCISRAEVIKLLEKEDWADTVLGVLSLPSVRPGKDDVDDDL